MKKSLYILLFSLLLIATVGCKKEKIEIVNPVEETGGDDDREMKTKGITSTTGTPIIDVNDTVTDSDDDDDVDDIIDDEDEDIDLFRKNQGK